MGIARSDENKICGMTGFERKGAGTKPSKITTVFSIRLYTVVL